MADLAPLPTQRSGAGSSDGPERAHAPASRWLALAVALTATVIVVLDNTVLSVAIPTIMDEFDTTLAALQWVITGYALTFATFLIIGGRLGDVHGHRKVFIAGATLFGAGSLLASMSWNVPSLVVGEALIEGLGASGLPRVRRSRDSWILGVLSSRRTPWEGRDTRPSSGVGYLIWSTLDGR